MKHLKFTKTNLTQLPHPTGKTPDRIFAFAFNLNHPWLNPITHHSVKLL